MKVGAQPSETGRRSPTGLPESLNEDGAEEDEQGREDQGQEGHHFPPETSEQIRVSARRAAVMCQAVALGFFSLA